MKEFFQGQSDYLFFIFSLFLVLLGLYFFRSKLLPAPWSDSTVNYRRIYLRKIGLALLGIVLLGWMFTQFLGNLAKTALQGDGIDHLSILSQDITHAFKDSEQKREALTEKERDLINRHPTYSYNLIKDFHLLSSEALLMVHQHHEQCNGTGYPEGLTETAIHPRAHLLHIVDGYEALTAKRSWRQAYQPVEALQIIRQEWEKTKKYNGAYLANFIRYLSSSL